MTEVKFLIDVNSGYFGRTLEEHTFCIIEPIDVNRVIYSIRKLACLSGFNKTNEVLLATAASELSVNILRYAISGEVILRTVEENISKKIGIEILAQDKGPGIKDLELALSESYTTYKNSLGQGLPSVVRIMDSFEIESIKNMGTRIVTCKWS